MRTQSLMNAIQLGHCMRCMRTSFQLASSASVGFMFLFTLSDWKWAALLAGVIAAILIVLWVAHILAYAYRASRSTPRTTASGDVMSKRELGALFAKFAAFAMIGSASPAFGQTCSDGRSPCFAGTCCGANQKCCCDNPTSKYCEDRNRACTC